MSRVCSLFMAGDFRRIFGRTTCMCLFKGHRFCAKEMGFCVYMIYEEQISPNKITFDYNFYLIFKREKTFCT